MPHARRSHQLSSHKGPWEEKKKLPKAHRPEFLLLAEKRARESLASTGIKSLTRIAGALDLRTRVASY